jgi:hypothetical protein
MTYPVIPTARQMKLKMRPGEGCCVKYGTGGRSERRTFAELVSVVANANGQDARPYIDRDCQEVGGRRRVPELGDDRRSEE